MILPFSVLALASAWIMIKNRPRSTDAHLDWTGLLALAIAIMCLQLGLDRGERLIGSNRQKLSPMQYAVGSPFIFFWHTS
ncbi:MAG: hypothetical protein CM1200mP41_16730 [Gammaproteobacteria bacterium]|nr:MAG: hypothetical protein CM1200mP41_16730 [Gammaproteobacteria bacterium]